MTHKCELKELVSQPALTIRKRTTAGRLSQIFSRGYAEITQYLTEIGSQPAGSPFASYYSLDKRDLDVELGFPVARTMKGKGDIISSKTPEGKAVGCLHTGPHSEIESAYYALGQWIKDNGYEATGVAYEVYLNAPEHTPPEELTSQIYLLIRRIKL